MNGSNPEYIFFYVTHHTAEERFATHIIQPPYSGGAFVYDGYISRTSKPQSARRCRISGEYDHRIRTGRSLFSMILPWSSSSLIIHTPSMSCLTGNDHEQFWSGSGVGDHPADHKCTAFHLHHLSLSYALIIKSLVSRATSG